MYSRRKAIIVSVAVLLTLGAGWYSWSVYRAWSDYQEGVRLFQTGTPVDDSECLRCLSATVQRPSWEIASEKKAHAAELAGLVGLRSTSALQMKEVFRILTAALKGQDVPVRRAAANSLTAIGSRYWVKDDFDPVYNPFHPFGVGIRVTGLLEKALADEDGTVRHTAVKGLAVTGVGGDLPQTLMKTLTDRDPSLRAETVVALGTIYQVGKLQIPYSDSTGKINNERSETVIKALVGTLQDDDPVVRERAAMVLQVIAPGRAAKDFPRALEEENLAVRIALGTEPVEGLVKALENEDRTIRYKAARALLAVKDTRVVAPLIRALQDDYQPVRFTAVQALGNNRDRASIEPLVMSLGDADSAVRSLGGQALAWMGTPGIAALKEALKVPEWNVRFSAAQGLVLVEDGTVSAALNEFVDRKRLAAALQAEDVVIREGAVRVAGKLRDKAFITLLVDALADQHVNVRYRAAEALGRIKHPAAVEPLIRALNDTSQPVRARAAETLGELEDPKAAGPLIQVIKKKGENHHVADFASTALVKIGGPAVPSLIEHLGNQGGSQSVRIGSTIWPIKAAFAQALGRIGLPAVEPLVKALKSNDPKVRNGAALALAILWDTSEYIQSHKSILHDEDYLVRGRDCQVFKRTDMWLPTEKTKPLPMIAVIWLESWGLPRSRPHPKVPTESTVMAALIVALQDEYPTRDEPEKYERYVRVWAAEALGLIGDARAVDPLRAALGDPVPEVVRIAANALGKIQDPRAVDALIQALKNPRARNSAAWNLGKVGDSRAVEPLVEAMKDQDQEFRKWAAEALAKITSRAAAPR